MSRVHTCRRPDSRAPSAGGVPAQPEPDRQRVLQICGDLMGAADHSLRTPLTSIVGYTEMLLDGDAGALTGAQAHMLESINTNCTRMVHLVQEMLDDVVRDLSLAAATSGEAAQPRAVR